MILTELLDSDHPIRASQNPASIIRLKAVRKCRSKMARYAPDIDDETIMKIPGDRNRIAYYDDKGARKSITMMQKILKLQLKEIEELMVILLEVKIIISEKGTMENHCKLHAYRTRN